MKVYKLTGYDPYWIYNDKIITFYHIEELLEQVNIADPWKELPAKNLNWNDINYVEFIDDSNSNFKYLKVEHEGINYYYKEYHNEKIGTINKDGKLLVKKYFELDEWQTHIHALVMLLFNHNALVRVKTAFQDRLERLNGKYRLNFITQRYLNKIDNSVILDHKREFVNGTNARKMYELNDPSYPLGDPALDNWVIHNWKNNSQTMTININQYFNSDENIEGHNHRFCYIIAKSSALRQINNSQDTSSNTTQDILIIPCPKSNASEILHALNDIGITIQQDSCIIIGQSNTIASKLSEVSFLLLFDWYTKNTDKSKFLFATNKIDNNTSINIPFFTIPFNQPLLFKIFNYILTNSNEGIGKKIRDLINNLDKLIPESEPLMLNPNYYYEFYNNGLTNYALSFKDLNLEFIEDQPVDSNLFLSAYFSFFSDINMSYYFGNKTNLLLPDLDNTNTKTVNPSISWGIVQGPSSTYLENNLNTGYTGKLNRESERQQAIEDAAYNSTNALLNNLNPLSWKFNPIAAIGNLIKSGITVAKIIRDTQLTQERADNSFYAGIKNTTNAPSNITADPYAKANIPLSSFDGNYLFLMFAITLHDQCKDLVFTNYLNNGYIIDAVLNINQILNRKYMNIVNLATSYNTQNYLYIWEKYFDNKVFKNKYWFTRALNFLNELHQMYERPYFVNCTDYKGKNYIHNIEKESYNIPTMKQNINSIIKIWPNRFPANEEQIWTILKPYNQYLTDDVIDNCNLTFDEYSIIISAKPESTNYEGQIIIHSYQYNLFLQFENTLCYVYDFNQLCGDGTLTVNTNIGEITIYVNDRFYTLDFIQNPSITEINDDFLIDKWYITAPTINLSGITKIGRNFMYISSYTSYDPKFNGNIILGNSLKSIGGNFLRNQIKYSSDLILPNSLLKIGTYFMYCCKKYTATIDFQNLNSSIFSSWPESEWRYLLSTNNRNDLCYTEGIKVKGTNISDIKQLLPDLNNNVYRKLIIVNENRK